MDSSRHKRTWKTKNDLPLNCDRRASQDEVNMEEAQHAAKDREGWKELVVIICPTGDKEDSSISKGFNGNILKLQNSSNFTVVDKGH